LLRYIAPVSHSGLVLSFDRHGGSVDVWSQYLTTSQQMGRSHVPSQERVTPHHFTRAASLNVSSLPLSETDCGGPWVYASACWQAAVLQQPFMCQVCRSWAALDRVVSAYQRNATKPSQLSGGIFLYEAQAIHAIQLLQTVIDRRGAATVCETGFNAGHSALLFLALPNTTVVTFDTFERGYQRAALHYIRHDLGLSSRLRFSVGDTAHTVRIFAQAHPHMRCDLAHPSVPSREHSDLLALRAMSHIPGAYVMPTALGSQSVLYGLTGLWKDALRSGVIKNSTCRPAIRPRSVGADFRFANSNTVIDHIFCWAQFANKRSTSFAHTYKMTEPTRRGKHGLLREVERKILKENTN